MIDFIKGADELNSFFSDIPMTCIPVQGGLHLKSCMTILGKDTILISSSASANSMRQEIELKSEQANFYNFRSVGDNDSAANILALNDVIVYPNDYKSEYAHLVEFDSARTVALENSEFKKIDGCLTCRSVFF